MSKSERLKRSSQTMGKNSTYENSRDYSGHNRNPYVNVAGMKRVWVKRHNGYPTSIMVGRFDIVDDLKAAVFQKYPNSIAKTHDYSELRILVSLQRREQSQQSKNPNKAPLTRLKGESNDSSVYRSRAPTDGVHNSLLSLLEPDQNVWEALDEYFGSDMKMSDAFLIHVITEQPPITANTDNSGSQRLEDSPSKGFEHITSPSPSYANTEKPTVIASSLQTPRPQNPQQVSETLISEKNSPESSRNLSGASPLSSHRRSQSSPSQSPVPLTSQSRSNNSQAVLLLPKNFSLGEQNSLKKMSLDERTSSRRKSNISSIGMRVTEKRLSVGDEDVKTANQFKDLEANTGSAQESSPENISHDSSNTNKDSRGDFSITRTGIVSKESKQYTTGKTLNTSTFEQVLPSISVLVVEDNSINQAILGAFLRKHKIHYQIAKNGQEAVDKWRKGGFHLVLMDIQLPVKSGIEATKEIRFLEKVNRIGVFAQHELTNNQAAGNFKIKEDQKLDLNVFRSPVIIVALTASSNSSVDKKNALTAGCNDFLTKPVNLVWLQNKITEWGCMQALINFDGWRGKGSSSTPLAQSVTFA